mmetsp:Transcript_28669/g.42958  ORF Transcript_28669/g.42958 Transcript_28669/m.42958 type:complete len:419 (+) Transcript_28669:166-1422(+)
MSIFIVAAKRTPFGAFGGSLKNLSATELGTIATTSALSSLPSSFDKSSIDTVIFGNVIQTSPDAAYLARHIQLKSGLAVDKPALTINRLCGSGFESIIQGFTSIKVGDASMAVCGGAENMSSAPLVADGNSVRWPGGVTLGSGLQLRDMLWDGLTDAYAGIPMGITAENLGKMYGISRLVRGASLNFYILFFVTLLECRQIDILILFFAILNKYKYNIQECDEFAIRSQQMWGEAKKNGVFDLEIAPVEVQVKRQTQVIDTDEHPRPETTLEKISKLKPVFQKDDGLVTAANASGICDGAGSIIIASEKAVLEHNLTPMARIASYHVSGCDPKIMGIGPVEAIRGALGKAGLNLDDVDRFEINEVSKRNRERFIFFFLMEDVCEVYTGVCFVPFIVCMLCVCARVFNGKFCIWKHYTG